MDSQITTKGFPFFQKKANKTKHNFNLQDNIHFFMPPNPCFVILKGMVRVLSVFLFSFKSRHLLKSQRRAEREIRSQRPQITMPY